MHALLAYLHSVEVLQHKVPDLRASLKKKKLETIGCNSQLLSWLRAVYVVYVGGWGGEGRGDREEREDEEDERLKEGQKN